MKARHRWLRVLRSRPRLWAALAVGGGLYGLWQALALADPPARALLAWNGCALSYLLAVLHMVAGATPARMERRAVRQADGRWLALVLVVATAAAVLAAVGSQLAAVKDMPGSARLPHVLLATLTIVSGWLFIQTLFAVQYAHDFYLGRAIGRDDALLFPGTKEPSYGDFFYFACVIGTSGQTADVAFNGRVLRPVGTLHCVLAFFFNAAVLALAINLGANLL